MKIRLQKETNVIKETIWYNIEKWTGTYWESVYCTQSGPEALTKFELLKDLDSEIKKETLQEFEKKDEKKVTK
jgi:hypothetical protein